MSDPVIQQKTYNKEAIAANEPTHAMELIQPLPNTLDALIKKSIAPFSGQHQQLAIFSPPSKALIASW